jgi:predicted Zn-dependent protease
LTAAPFAIATRDELWIHGRLVERRLAHGEAIEDEHGIRAVDVREPLLVAACDAAMDELRACVIPDARVRLVAEASGEELTKTIVVTLGGISVVTTPEHIVHDVALLRSASTPRPSGDDTHPRDIPLLWKHGSAAVLLHEAVGHALEHGQAPLDLPSWLTIDVPLQLRRASFKDVPLLRMTNVVARQTNAPFALPARRIEIVLVDGGSYDPLTELVTVRVAAAQLVDGDDIRALAPFTIHESRATIADSIVGAAGESLRYPGVICSREGQELIVGSHAPLMLTEFR